MDTITQMFTFLSLSYIVSLIIASYITITTITVVLNKELSTMIKRIITLVVGLILAGCYHEMKLITMDSLIPSFLLAIVGYDYFIKQLLSKLEDHIRSKKESDSNLPPTTI